MPTAADRHMPATLDLAVVNIPLAKRGDIDAQIDRYNAARAAEARRLAMASARQKQADKALARELLAAYGAAILSRHGARFGERALENTLDQWAKWEPRKLIDFVARFQREA